MVTPVQILNEAVCILHRANALENSIHPTVLPPGKDK